MIKLKGWNEMKLKKEMALKIIEMQIPNDKLREALLGNLNIVNCIPFKSIPDLRVDTYHVKMKQCFLNSMLTSLMDEKIYYVEGYIIDPIIPFPVHHSWNKFEEDYFDLTQEVALKSNVTKNCYYSLFEISDKQFFFDYNDPFHTPMFAHYMQKLKLRGK